MANEYLNEMLYLRIYLLLIGDWDAQVGSQEIPGMAGRFGIRVQNEAGKRLTEIFQENMLVITTMTQMTTMVWSVPWIRTSWSVKSNGP